MKSGRLKQLLFLSSVLVAAVAATVVAKERESSVPVARTLMDPTQLDGIDGWNVSVVHAEQKPGGAAGWHYHNGYEIVVVQKGGSSIELKGQKPRIYRAGEAYVIPRGVPHRVHNVSMTEPYEIMVFLVMENGKPVRVELPNE